MEKRLGEEAVIQTRGELLVRVFWQLQRVICGKVISESRDGRLREAMEMGLVEDFFLAAAGSRNDWRKR